MNTQDSPHKYFSYLLEVGKTVLDTKKKEIINLFKSHEMCLMEYRCKGVINKVMELQFDIAVLTCIFDNLGLCRLSILYVQSLNDIAHYIRFCDNNFSYNYEHNIWQRKVGYIRLKHADDTGNRIAFIQCLNKDSILKDKIE